MMSTTPCVGARVLLRLVNTRGMFTLRWHPNAPREFPTLRLLTPTVALDSRHTSDGIRCDLISLSWWTWGIALYWTRRVREQGAAVRRGPPPPVLLPEDEAERAMFNRSADHIHGGDSLATVVTVLGLLARISPPDTTHARQLAICANEVAKASHRSKTV